MRCLLVKPSGNRICAGKDNALLRFPTMLALSVRSFLRSSLRNVTGVGITAHPLRSVDDSGRLFERSEMISRVGRSFADL
jgi:hypothetical protein